MARPSRGASARAGVRSQLAASFRARAATARWPGGPEHWRGLAGRLDAGGPVDVRGYLLGDLLPSGVDSLSTVRVQPDGSLSVVHADARERVQARYPGLRAEAQR